MEETLASGLSTPILSVNKAHWPKPMRDLAVSPGKKMLVGKGLTGVHLLLGLIEAYQPGQHPVERFLALFRNERGALYNA